MIFYINSELKDEDVVAEIYTRNKGGARFPRLRLKRSFRSEQLQGQIRWKKHGQWGEFCYRMFD